jgi:hypothetical protein
MDDNYILPWMYYYIQELAGELGYDMDIGGQPFYLGERTNSARTCVELSSEIVMSWHALWMCPSVHPVPYVTENTGSSVVDVSNDPLCDILRLPKHFSPEELS